MWAAGRYAKYVSWYESEVGIAKSLMKSKKPPTAATTEECLSMTPCERVETRSTAQGE
jgi:hypothetical protein